MAVEDSLDIFGSDPFGRDYLYGLSTGRDGQGLAPYGIRYAENLNQPTTAKGRGYLGNVGTMQDPMTELSASSEIGGRTVQYPLIVPTLTAQELNLLRSGGEPTQEIYGKAQQYALGRLSRGQDPFATTQELRYPQPQAVDTRPYDQMQATPRGFTSGLFSDVLGRTLNMPSIPKTGIPALDLLYMNRNPVLNMMGVGDVQKTAERISYGQPLTTGSGMTLRPREEAVFAGMAVAPFVGEAVNLGARAGRAGARMVGERIAENVTMGRPNLPSMFAEPRSSLFAVEPSTSMAAADESSAMRQQLTGKMQALLAQKKVATSAVEVGAINQQIGELQAQFKSLPAAGRLASRAVRATEGMPVGMGIKDVGKSAITKEGNPIQGAVVLVGDKIFMGRTHGDALNRAVYEGAVRKEGGKYIYPKGAEVNSDLFMTKDGQIIDRLQASKMFDIGASETAIEKGLMQKNPPKSMTVDSYIEQATALKKQREQSPHPQQAALPTQYPLAPAGTRYEEFGGDLTYMTPDEFLQQVRPLQLDAESLDNIAALRSHVESGGKLDPLHIYASGKEDGRHRAYLAKELGIEKVPVALHGQTPTPIASPTYTDPFGNTIGSSIR